MNPMPKYSAPMHLLYAWLRKHTDCGDGDATYQIYIPKRNKFKNQVVVHTERYPKRLRKPTVYCVTVGYEDSFCYVANLDDLKAALKRDFR